MPHPRALAAAVTLAASLAALATPAAAQRSAPNPGYLLQPPVAAITIHGGYAQPRSQHDFWDFSFQELTMARGDLGGASGGVDLAVPVSSRFDVVVGLSRAWSRHDSEMREWVDLDDLPIEQTTRLARSTIGATVRYQFRPRGRTIGSYAWIPNNFTPWLGAGLGRMHYRLEQAGDFVDFETLAIFGEQFESEGWTTFLQASGGAGWTISPRLDLTAELRYIQARAPLGVELFRNFDRLDLSGISTLVGLTVRL